MIVQGPEDKPKHAGGRPPHFNSADELQAEIEVYFDALFVSKERATITGLALYLGFASRQSFYDYEKDGEFSYCIKRARLRIESIYESALHGTSPTGAIFALKNFGWSDKQEIDQKTEHSGEIVIKWQDPDIQHPEDKGSNGEL